MKIFGIINITDDSFFAPSRTTNLKKATKYAHNLIKDGAYSIDIGARSSHPSAKKVSFKVELDRILSLLKILSASKAKISVDSYSTKIQRLLLTEHRDLKIDYLNDINGFNNPDIYPEIKEHNCGLIVMHSAQSKGPADIRDVSPKKISLKIIKFFDKRLNELIAAGINENRIILDPGMGFFLGDDPFCSVKAIKLIMELKEIFSLPVMLSVSRKSFLRKLTNCTLEESLAPTLAAEIFAFHHKVDFLRTHDVKSLVAATKIWQILQTA